MTPTDRSSLREQVARNIEDCLKWHMEVSDLRNNLERELNAAIWPLIAAEVAGQPVEPPPFTRTEVTAKAVEASQWAGTNDLVTMLCWLAATMPEELKP